MTIKEYMKALPLVAALLLIAACSNQDLALVEELQPEARIIPITANVSTDIQTRATYQSLSDGSHYLFQEGERLFVWGTDNNQADGTVVISGELTLAPSTGGSSSGSFSGNLIYTGEGAPSNSLVLYAVLKSPNDLLFPSSVAEFVAGTRTPTYPDVLATSTYDAISKFSYFLTSAYFSNTPSFYFSSNQGSTFLSFDVILENGATDPSVAVSIKNNGSALRSGSATVVTEGGKRHAKFVAAFPRTELYNATVTLGSRPAINFGSTISSAPTTLDENNIYQVTKDYNGYKITTSASMGGVPLVTDKVLGSVNTLPQYKTTTELLSEYGPTAAALASNVESCEYVSGDNNVSKSGSAPDFTLSVTGVGTSNFDVTALGKTVNLSITVAKLIP